MESELEIVPALNLDASKSDMKPVIQDLFDYYMDSLDDQRFEEWPKLFMEDAVYKIIARENVERDLPLATWSCMSRGMMLDRVVAIRNACVYSPRYLRHVASPVRVSFQKSPYNSSEPGFFTATSSFSVFETTQDEMSRVFLVGKYSAKVVLTSQGPRFQELLVIYDTSLIPGLLVFPV